MGNDAGTLMKRFAVKVWIGLSIFLYCGGCVEQTRPEIASPVVLICYWDDANFAIGGRLMSSVSESSLVRKQSGSIEGRDADGWALHTESSGDHPVFECLFLTSRENGRRVERIVGKSSVEWRLLVESTVSLRQL